jgi:hypothetical protein
MTLSVRASRDRRYIEAEHFGRLQVDRQLGPQPFLGLVKSEIARWTPIIQVIGPNRPFDANLEFG